MPSVTRSWWSSSGDAYTLVLDPQSVDAVRVVELAVEVSTARAAADAATVLQKGTEALALFRGEALVDSGDWATAHRARLEEVRLGLLEDVMSARVDLGSGGELVGELEALVEQHPLREGLWSSLITALYRAGRQAEALSAYARVRRLLVDELGIEPGEALRDLERQVLQQSLGMAASGTHPVAVPGNIPAGQEALVGREEDLEALTSLLEQDRLVTSQGRPASARPAWPSRSPAASSLQEVSGSCASSRWMPPLPWLTSSPRRCT